MWKFLSMQAALKPRALRQQTRHKPISQHEMYTPQLQAALKPRASGGVQCNSNTQEAEAIEHTRSHLRPPDMRLAPIG